MGSDINGDGKYKIEIEDVTGNIKFKPSITKVENGKTFMKVDKIKILLDPKKYASILFVIKLLTLNFILEQKCSLQIFSMEMM